MRIRPVRLLAAPAALGFAAVIGLGLAAPAASAQPAYGPTATATLTCSATTVAEGATITCSGAGYDAFETVLEVIHSDPETLGSVQTNATGQFTASVTIPTNIAPGTHTITDTGETSGHSASVTIDVLAPTTAAAVPPAAPSSSLAFTGIDVAEVAGVGAAALAAGGGLVLVARRRRRDHFA